MSSLEDHQHFDTIIIGAGMSGLAAGIRLALFDQSVLILERHNAIGGLNSFYSFDGRKYDVGLHALTNYVPKGTRGTPLTKILKQLRIPYDSLNLAPQLQSRIAFNDFSLKFSNDIALLTSEIETHFPTETDGFLSLINAVKHTFTTLDTPSERHEPSARKVIGQHLKSPQLIDALLTPIMFYGSSQEHDLPWAQFSIIFQSIYLEGFARPLEGIRPILKILKDKFKSLGGIRKMKCGVHKIITQGSKATHLLLDNGLTLSADKIISSAGLPETLRLCDNQPQNAAQDNIGKLSFTETITVFKDQPQSLGWNDTIIFFNDHDTFEYQQPSKLVDPRSGVICFPNNYDYSDGEQLPEGILRTTALANFDLWNALPQDDYTTQKAHFFDLLQRKAQEFLPPIPPNYFAQNTLATDMFTPTTVKKFTGHENGAIYGATHKQRDGRTHLDNLYICGTDQGYLGITGTMISGIATANQHVLANT